jgi:tripartite-type tricarboxylate transporter receptor subunit TctC
LKLSAAGMAGAFALAFAGLSAWPAAAQDWPNRPVRIVSAFAAGGAADIVARTVADHFSTAFNQQFFVETRAGASGTIAVKSVAEAPPDGYNLVVTTSTLLVLLPASNPKLGYDPIKGLTNIGYIAGTPIVLSVNGKSAVKTLKDFVAHGKQSAKPLAYSSSGLGSSGHLVAEVFAQQAGIRIDHVPYKGGSQGLTDLIGGHIDFASQTLPSTASYMRGGALVPIAHSARERIPDFPDVPTLKELGYDVVSTTWYSLSGPPGLPDEIVQKLNRELVRGMATPESQARLKQNGLIAEPMTVAEFRSFVNAETSRWKPVVEAAGLAGKK